MTRLVGKVLLLLVVLAVALYWWLWPASTPQPSVPAPEGRPLAFDSGDASISRPGLAKAVPNDAEAEARDAWQQAWEDWHALVSRVADDVGGLKLSRSPLFTALVKRLPDEIQDQNETRSAADRVEQTARLRVLHKALEIYHTQWLSMRAAREALAEQRKLWQHLSQRHQFGMSASQSDAIQAVQQRIEAFARQEDFPAATREYQRLRALYEIEEEPINLMLDARRAAMAARAQWQAREASQTQSHPVESEAAQSFEQAQVAALHGDYTTATAAYGQATRVWRSLYRASLSRSERTEDIESFH